MRNQLNSSDDSKNQFINQGGFNSNQFDSSNNQNENIQKMFFMFKKMATDPTLFMKMMGSINSNQSQSELRRRQFQVEQHKYRNHQVSPRSKNTGSPVSKQQSRVKGRDVTKKYNQKEADKVLQKYLSPQNQINEKLAQSTVTISTREQHIIKYQEKPIQSSYSLSQQNNAQKKSSVRQQNIPPASIPVQDDQRPIKPAKGYNYDSQLNQSMTNNSSLLQQPVNPSKYMEAQQRPIKGIQGDFKNYIMKQQGFPITQFPDQNKQEYQNQDVPRARPFLKRGSRQHLSSAIDKSTKKDKVKTKISQNTNEDENPYKNNMKENNERSISQNRVLGRKSVSSKSITKKPPIKANKEQEQKVKNKFQTSNAQSNYASLNLEGNKTPRGINRKQKQFNQQERQDSSSPTFNKYNKKQERKTPKKNIFEQQSSDDQKGQRNQNKGINLNKTQVIPGVFLTKKQLHQILTKYSKSNQPSTNDSEAQIQQLKSKYIDLCNILTQQKNLFEIQMQKQKESFEAYKQAQILKLKNEKKVQERNMMNNQKNKQRQKQKEQLENLRKNIEKQRQQFRHKQKNYKIMIQKYKKIAQQKQKQAPSQQQKQYKPIGQEYSSKQQQARQKRRTSNINPDYSIQNNETINEQNTQVNINRRDTTNNSYYKQNKDNKNKQKLPNYQDLKKSNVESSIKSNTNTHAHANPNRNSSQIAHQNVDKNKKYEYYQELQNKQTVKGNQKYTGLNSKYQQEDQQNQQNQQPQQQQDQTQQIVQYNPTMKLIDLTKIPLNIKMVTDDMIQNLFRYQNNPEYRKYLQLTKSKPRTRIHTSRNAVEKKTTNVYADGGKEVVFDTGVRKEYFSSGYVIIFFANGDIKQKLPDQTVLYFYRQKQVDQITLPNKINIYRFDNNQVEFHFEDETVQIRHPDGTFKII